jgi:hypothetical protein
MLVFNFYLLMLCPLRQLIEILFQYTGGCFEDSVAEEEWLEGTCTLKGEICIRDFC